MVLFKLQKIGQHEINLTYKPEIYCIEVHIYAKAYATYNIDRNAKKSKAKVRQYKLIYSGF